MAPFPESEDMTIKRLVVALRKNDLQLLKMGTYKLHEKFHTGFEFELVDDLRAILETVEKKQYPPEISDILCSTIKDILSKKAMREISKENQILPQNSGRTPIPSNLEQPAEDIKELAQIINSQGSSTGEIKPVQVNLPEANQVRLNTEPNYQNTYYRPNQPAASAQPVNSYQANMQPAQSNIQNQMPQGQQIQTQTPPPPPEETGVVKNIAVFFDDFKTDIDYSDVKNYKNNLNLLFSKNQNRQDYDILQQISALTQLLDTNISDIDKIISMLTTSKGKVSFITASQSQNISKIFVERNIDFDIPFVKKAQNKATAFDFIPMVGSTNIFVCSNCNLRTLKTDFNTRTLSVQCPHCEGAAFPDIYAVNSYNPDCNPVFWHRAFGALIKSQIWILVNPPLDENKEIVVDFIKTAYEASTPSKIYILSRENDKREFYRQMFMSINEKCTVKFNFSDQDKLCEEFINEEIIRKVFA